MGLVVGFWHSLTSLRARPLLKVRVLGAHQLQRAVGQGCSLTLLFLPASLGLPVLVDESSLTGESLAVTKGRGDAMLQGAVVQSGELYLLVEKTGADTLFGKALELLGKTEVHAIRTETQKERRTASLP